MKILVKAKPGSRQEKVERVDELNYVVFVKAPPKDGQANAAMVKLLSVHFDVSPTMVEIISGHMSRIKVVEIHS